MNHNRPVRPSSGHDSTMYDDELRADEYHRSTSTSQGYHNSRQDSTRSPQRGLADGERPMYGERRHMDDREHDYDRRRLGSPRREGRSRYTDSDREGYQSPARDRSRSRSPYFGGPPNRNVILEGIPIAWTQEDILYELQHGLALEGLEEIRLIKDKRTGQSRGFAFAQFAGINEARRFLNSYYPNVQLYGPRADSKVTSNPSSVRIAYSRDREDRDKAGKGEDDWKCDVCSLLNFPYRTLCFRCNSPRTRATAHGVVVAQTNMSAFSGFSTTGDSDASPDGVASQFLLLRGLEPGVTEELFAKGVSKLCKTKANTPPTDAQNTKKRTIASTTTDASLGAKDGSLRRVLLIRDRKTNDSWRYGFAEFNTVEDAQAAMIKYKASDKFTISSKPVQLSYIHAGVFVPVLSPLGDEYLRFTFSPLSNAAMKLMYWDEAAYASELVVASADAPSIIKTRESEHAKLAAAAANEGLLGSGREGEPRPKKRKVDKDAKVVAPHLQFWTNRHAELHGIPPKDPVEDTLDVTSSKIGKKVATPIPTDSSSQTFADLERKCCLLCSRQFKTEAEVNKHERVSQLHRDNMKNEDLVSKALAKLNKSKDVADGYRDRAKERRQAFNQPKQPAAQHNRAGKDSNDPTPKPKNEESEPALPPPSRGAALLGKMGWSAGEGLGAKGTGRTNAIVPELYTQGVGLGAQGGKIGDAVEEAHRQTKGSYADFVNKAKDKAKERFESLA